MKYNEQEMIQLKENLKQMWLLVLTQLELSKRAILHRNNSAGLDVISNEKRVDAFDLKMDSDCENYIALYNPVAIDLRCALSLIKISSTLERIADFCHSIARFSLDPKRDLLSSELIKELQVEQIMDAALRMFAECFAILQTENTHTHQSVLAQDDSIDELYHRSFEVIAAYIREHPDSAVAAMEMLLVMRKIERIGDYCSNIVEDLVFFVDAKVLKHSTEEIDN